MNGSSKAFALSLLLAGFSNVVVADEAIVAEEVAVVAVEVQEQKTYVWAQEDQADEAKFAELKEAGYTHVQTDNNDVKEAAEKAGFVVVAPVEEAVAEEAPVEEAAAE